MSNPILVNLVNPFVRNPSFDQPENNFIEQGISNGIERGLGKIGENILHAGQLKLESFAQNLPQLLGIALVSYYVYIGYKIFFKQNTKDLEYIFPVTIAYIIFKLFWKVVLGI